MTPPLFRCWCCFFPYYTFCYLSPCLFNSVQVCVLNFLALSLSFSLPFNNNENNDEGAEGLCNAELHPKWVIRSSFFLFSNFLFSWRGKIYPNNIFHSNSFSFLSLSKYTFALAHILIFLLKNLKKKVITNFPLLKIVSIPFSVSRFLYISKPIRSIWLKITFCSAFKGFFARLQDAATFRWISLSKWMENFFSFLWNEE